MFNVIKISKILNIVSGVLFVVGIVFLCTADPSKDMSAVQVLVVWGVVTFLSCVGAFVFNWTNKRLDQEKQYQEQVEQRRIDRQLDKYDNIIRVNFVNR